MIRTVRIHDPARTFVVGDPHFNHAHPEIMKMRGVASADEMNAWTIARWNERIPVDADVWMLGDFCLSDPEGRATREVLRRLNGRVIHLLWGNHNSGVKHLYREILARQIFPHQPKHALNYEVYPVRTSIARDKTVEFVGRMVDMLWRRPGARADQEITLNHYAQRQWLHGSRGAWMICGHSHGNDEAIARTDDAGLGKILEVGFDTTGPLSILEIDAIMAGKPCRREREMADDEDTAD